MTWRRTSAGGWVGTATSALDMNTNAISGVTTLALSGNITQGADTDITNIFGRCRIDSRTTDTVNISHYDRDGATQYAFLCNASGAVNVQGQNSTFPVTVLMNGTNVARFDASGTTGDTRFLVYDVDNAGLARVSVGADDSGGVGFKVLRVPN